MVSLKRLVMSLLQVSAPYEIWFQLPVWRKCVKEKSGRDKIASPM